jgi:hypothetical protein
MTTLLTAAAVLGLAAQCQHSFPPAMILAIAKQESRIAPDQFDAAAEAVLRQFSQYNSGNPTRSADYAKRAYLALHGAASVQPTPTTEAPKPTTARPAIFARKAKIGRELVTNFSKENQ